MAHTAAGVAGVAGGVRPVRAWRAPRRPGTSLLAAHLCAVGLARAQLLVTAALSRALRPFVSGRMWEQFGAARLEDHAREHFGRTGRWARDMAALGESFTRLPGLELALTGEDGGRPLGRVAALMVGRMAKPATLAHWLERARSTTVRGLRGEIARQPADARRGGDQVGEPAGEPDPESGPDTCGGQGGEVAEESESNADRARIRLAMPRAVLAAWEEGLDLYRAVEGWNAPAGEFAEALAAEAASDSIVATDLGNDAVWGESEAVAAEARSTVSRTAATEEELAMETDLWEDLPSRAGVVEAERVLFKLKRLPPLPVDPGGVDARVRCLIEIEDEIARRMGRVLADLDACRAWARLGFSGAAHYAEAFLGLNRRTALERVQLEKGLPRLPATREAYERGTLGLKAALELLRLLGANGAGRYGVEKEVERAWVSHARQVTLKRLRDEIHLALRRLSGGVRDRERPEARHLARSDVPGPATDRQWQASLRREAGTAKERVMGLGWMAAEDETADAVLRLSLPTEPAAMFLGAIAARRLRLEREALASGTRARGSLGGESPEPGPSDDRAPSREVARLFSRVGRPVPAWNGLLSLLEEFVSVWDPPRRGRRGRVERVYEREGWRCMAPGCTSRRHLEAHHVLYRSRGGGDGQENLVTACRWHHRRGEHAGLLRCRGRAPLGVIWKMGCFGLGGLWKNERRVIGSRRP